MLPAFDLVHWASEVTPSPRSTPTDEVPFDLIGWATTDMLGVTIWGGFILIIVGGVLSAISKVFRNLVRRTASWLWRSFIHLLLWVPTVRVRFTTTTAEVAARDDAVGEGRREVVSERQKIHAVPRPKAQWSIDVMGWREMSSNAIEVRLTNSVVDAPATHVQVSARPAWFTFTTPPSWPDSPNAQQVWFHGRPTERGRAEGVDFEVTWTDALGDRKKASVHVDGSEFPLREAAPATPTITPEAHAAAVEAAREAGRAAAEAAHELARHAQVIRPRWFLTSAVHEGLLQGRLENLATESNARSVRVEVNPFLYSIKGTGQWLELNGGSVGWFPGYETPLGSAEGVVFTVHWTGSNGQEYHDQVPLDGSGPAFHRPQNGPNDSMPFVM